MIHKRSFRNSIRAEKDSLKIEGYAYRWGDHTRIDGMDETIEPGSFEDTLREDDIMSFMGHNPERFLGRMGKNLKLYEDKEGLKYELDLPDTSEGRDAYELARKGLLGASIGMEDFVAKEGEGMRVINKVRLKEVSLTPMPAYKNTTAEARNKNQTIYPPELS